MYCLSPELAYIKHGNAKEIHFQEIVVEAMYCNRDPDVH